MILDSDLVFDENDLLNTCNNVTHQSQPIFSNDSPGGFIESPMWVGCKPENSQSIVIKNILFQVNLRSLGEKFPNGNI